MDKYNDYAIVLTWEILNDVPDIGNWTMLFEEDNSEINGNGMSELLETLLQLRQDLVNVIYVKSLNLFEVIGESYFSYSSDFMAVIKDKQINFFNLRIFEWVQLVNWDSFWKEVEDGKEFLRRLSLCREGLKGNNKNRLSLKSHYRITIAADQWFDITQKYYLKGKWANQFRLDLVPQDQEELELLLKVYKASYFFTNPRSVNRQVGEGYSYDISSSHAGFICRKKYPSSSSIEPTSGEEIKEVVEKGFYAWIGEFEFVDLKENVPLPIDLRKFGYINQDDNWQLVLTNAHWNAFKRLFSYKEIRPISFRYYQNKELQRNYAIMVNELYSEKEQAKQNETDKFIISTRKFRTELPFGQSIKSPTFFQFVAYNEETGEFEKWKADPQSFEEIINKIKDYALPMQVGIWTAAYSWAEEVNMILDIGYENVVYGDTDNVKFIGEKGLKVIEEHNKEIDKEFDRMNRKRLMLETSDKIGRWQFEGKFNQFKAIGTKWYLTEWEKKGLEVKCAGADGKVLLDWLKEQENPFESFEKDLSVPGLRKIVGINRKDKTVHVNYSNYIDDGLLNEMIVRSVV